MPDLFLFYKRALLGNRKRFAVLHQYISVALKLTLNKNKLYKNLDHSFRYTLNFVFLEIDLGIVFPPHFVYDFSRKICLMLYSINRPNFIVWLFLLLEILGNVCIATVCFPECDVINFEINFTFPINLFFYMIKTCRQKSKYLESEKSFRHEIKSIFLRF